MAAIGSIAGCWEEVRYEPAPTKPEKPAVTPIKPQPRVQDPPANASSKAHASTVIPVVAILLTTMLDLFMQTSLC